MRATCQSTDNQESTNAKTKIGGRKLGENKRGMKQTILI
jgi:hypothetical protein